MSEIAHLAENRESESLTRMAIQIRNTSPQYDGSETPADVAADVLNEELSELAESDERASELQDNVRDRLGLNDDTDGSEAALSEESSEAEEKQKEIRERITGGK